MTAAAIYQQVTDRIVALLEQGERPWAPPAANPHISRATGASGL